MNYNIQTDDFVSNNEIETFVKRFDHILVHLDIDVLDPKEFHSTYFASPDLVGDGSGGGKMPLAELGKILQIINQNSTVVGMTIAEYLPFDEERLHKMFLSLDLFTK